MTERDELTPDERDTFSEDELVEYDLRHVKRGPGITEDALRRLVGDRVRRERDKKAQAAADLAAAAKAGTTVEAIRVARAERATAEAARRHAQQLVIARRAVTPPGRGHGPEPIVSEDEVRRVWDELGDAASYGAVAKRLGVHKSTIRRRLGKL